MLGVSSLLCEEDGVFICSSARCVRFRVAHIALWRDSACRAAKASWRTFIPLTPACIYISGGCRRAGLWSVFCLCLSLFFNRKILSILKPTPVPRSSFHASVTAVSAHSKLVSLKVQCAVQSQHLLWSSVFLTNWAQTGPDPAGGRRRARRDHDRGPTETMHRCSVATCNLVARLTLLHTEPLKCCFIFGRCSRHISIIIKAVIWYINGK